MTASLSPAVDAATSIRPESVEHWAAVRPDAVALVEGDSGLTWAAWNDQANRVAEGLAQRGVGAGDIVVVRTQIRSEWAVISAALAKLGCSLLGLNWRLTPSETDFVLGNSRADAIICDDIHPDLLAPVIASRNLKVAASIDVPSEAFIDYAELLAAAPVERYSKAEAPLVIYTSGTTGLPKGVVMSAGPGAKAELLAYLAGVELTMKRTEDDVALVTMPFSHGSGPAQVRSALRVGSRLVLMQRYDPEAVLAAIERHKVTIWVAVPTMIKRLAALPSATLAHRDVSSIRIIQLGAAPVTRELKAWVIDYFGDHVLHEGYGSTETGMISHMPPHEQRSKPGSSGKPYPLVDVEIRDSDGVVLSADEVGEIWVRTPMVISGYLNAAPLDEETRDPAGFFRVGDVGRIDSDGYLFITDRAKDMIVSGGVNIYPAEIEAALMRNDAVQDAAVIGIPDDEFGEQVKAFIEVKPGRLVTIEDIAATAKEHLASYKRPKTIDLIDELPRNAMGKILKRDLRAPYWVGRERSV